MAKASSSTAAPVIDQERVSSESVDPKEKSRLLKYKKKGKNFKILQFTVSIEEYYV